MEYRLNKYISNSGFCSRREADKLIEEGRVTIDGRIAELGTKVLPGQEVRVNGELIESKQEYIYIALNKPVGIVCTTDPKEKKNIADYINYKERIFPIGRLDKDSQGLILLTNDGDIVNKILRAGNNHQKEYIVTVDKPITQDFLKKMSQGVPILDTITKKCELEKISSHVFKIILTQGLNRQIRRMTEYLGYEVVKLERIQIMNIKLDNLKYGSWRNLTESEKNELFKSLENSVKTAFIEPEAITQNQSSKKSGKQTETRPKNKRNYNKRQR